jgi:hypothetical protein
VPRLGYLPPRQPLLAKRHYGLRLDAAAVFETRI